MLAIHPSAQTPAGRAELARSTEPTGVLAARYGRPAAARRAARPRRVLQRLSGAACYPA